MLLRPETREPPVYAVGGITLAQWRLILLGVGLVVVAAIPFVLKNFYIFQITLAIIYAIAILGLNLLTGFNGQFSLGHSAFYAIGAYTAAIMMENLGISYVWTIPAAAVVCFVFGFLFGLPALRLEGIYLALATFALAIAIPQALKSTVVEHWTGGVQGIVIIKPDAPFGLPLNSDQWLYVLHRRGRDHHVCLRRQSGEQPHRPRADRDPRPSGRGERDGHQRLALQVADLRGERALYRRRGRARRDRDRDSSRPTASPSCWRSRCSSASWSAASPRSPAR